MFRKLASRTAAAAAVRLTRPRVRGAGGRVVVASCAEGYGALGHELTAVPADNWDRELSWAVGVTAVAAALGVGHAECAPGGANRGIAACANSGGGGGGGSGSGAGGSTPSLHARNTESPVFMTQQQQQQHEAMRQHAVWQLQQGAAAADEAAGGAPSTMSLASMPPYSSTGRAKCQECFDKYLDAVVRNDSAAMEYVEGHILKAQSAADARDTFKRCYRPDFGFLGPEVQGDYLRAQQEDRERRGAL